MRLVPNSELLGYLAASRDGDRQSLTILQAAPVTPRGFAFLPIADGNGPLVEKALTEESLDSILRVVLTDELLSAEPEFYDSLLPGLHCLRVGHDADRFYDGYGPFIETLTLLAKYLEDGRLFIRDECSSWLDDLRIHQGQLTVTRWEPIHPDILDYEILTERAAQSPEDPEAHRLARLLHLRQGEFHTRHAFQSSGREQRAHVADAFRILKGAPPDLAAGARALLHLVVGQSNKATEAAHSVAPPVAMARWVLAAIAFAEERDEEAGAEGNAALQTAPWLAEARLLAAWGGPPESRMRHRQALVDQAHGFATAYPKNFGAPFDDTRMHLLMRGGRDQLLDAVILAAADEAKPERRIGAALLLCVWAEGLRLEAQGDRRDRHRRAARLFDRAEALHDFGGEVARRRSLLKY